ncbi:unnamed protein product [Clonostachys byssicola]|uniref:DUF6604 domain-containing protein n=1 Tax=Clonostachys byssicola TaxID=160290 RepID=A0A9N9UGL5_9HYPO|nr:unnamed protein product [Clonostachys byssicola]
MALSKTLLDERNQSLNSTNTIDKAAGIERLQKMLSLKAQCATVTEDAKCKMMLKNASVLYLRYKNDTDSLASWLASTAEHHGHPLGPLLRDQGNASTQKSTGRLKVKARREARNAEPKSAKYIIPLHDFTQLANFIAKKRPRVDIPPSLISTFDRSINLRAGFARLLAQQGM